MSNRDDQRQQLEESAAAEEVAAEFEAESVAQHPPPETSKVTAKGAARKAAKEAAKREKAEKAAALAALEAEMPKLAAVLKDLNYTPELRADWLTHFKNSGLPDGEVTAIVDPKPEPKKRLRPTLLVMRHGLVRWLRGPGLVVRLAYAVGWLYLLVSSAAKLHWRVFALLSLVVVVVGKLRFVVRDLKPKNMQLIDRGYNERKLLLQQLIECTQRWYASPPTTAELERYRRDALTLVANYVRDHRSRFGSREILANLMVRDGDRYMVVGRSDGVRPVPQTYTRDQCGLVAQAIESGEAKITGDLYRDFPETAPGKKYRSVLVLPIWLRGAVVGAVSIDSQEMYHFHLDFDDLQVHLQPYVQLLAMDLRHGHDVEKVRVT